ncbi:MAG TPA: GNAT family protein [Acidimicrobiales bacterium]|nr:GNAT family protein [Acidimicrobiales bacterium]
MTELWRVGPLEGRLVRLDPLTEEHVDALLAASSEDRSAYGFTTVPNGLEEVRAYVKQAVSDRDTGEGVPFVQVQRATGRVVGTTRFTNLRRDEGRLNLYAVEIGWTWLAASAQRSGINVEAKLLLVGHAFEVWGVGRVDLKTDSRNLRSQKAIGALGATREGVLRNWQPSHAEGEPGLLRDTVMFSFVSSEWPEVKRGLETRLESGGTGN